MGLEQKLLLDQTSPFMGPTPLMPSICSYQSTYWYEEVVRTSTYTSSMGRTHCPTIFDQKCVYCSCCTIRRGEKPAIAWTGESL